MSTTVIFVRYCRVKIFSFRIICAAYLQLVHPSFKEGLIVARKNTLIQTGNE